MRFAKLLPISPDGLASSLDVCNLIRARLLRHRASGLRLNQAHLDDQFPVARLSLNLVGGVMQSSGEKEDAKRLP